MTEPATFTHTARDGVALFWIVLIVFFPGGIMLGPPFISMKIFAGSMIAYAIIAIGADCKITVGPSGVRFARRIFGIPYYVVHGDEIRSVCYDSDWDEEETASGVVVDIDGKEVHIGAARRKTQLYTELFRRSADYRRMMARHDTTPAPTIRHSAALGQSGRPRQPPQPCAIDPPSGHRRHRGANARPAAEHGSHRRVAIAGSPLTGLLTTRRASAVPEAGCPPHGARNESLDARSGGWQTTTIALLAWRCGSDLRQRSQAAISGGYAAGARPGPLPRKPPVRPTRDAPAALMSAGCRNCSLHPC